MGGHWERSYSHMGGRGQGQCEGRGSYMGDGGRGGIVGWRDSHMGDGGRGGTVGGERQPHGKTLGGKGKWEGRDSYMGDGGRGGTVVGEWKLHGRWWMGGEGLWEGRYSHMGSVGGCLFKIPCCARAPGSKMHA